MQSNISSYLQTKIEQFRSVPDKNNTALYEMPWSLSSMLTLLTKSVRLKLNADVNWTIKLNQKQTKASAKQSSIRWCWQCNKPSAIKHNKARLAQRYELKTNYVHKATNWNKSCPLNIQTKNTYNRNNINMACQLLDRTWW